MSQPLLPKPISFLSFLLCFTLSCSTSAPKKEVAENPPEAKKQLAKGLNLLKGKKPVDGITTLTQLTKSYPTSEASYQAKIAMGDYYYLKAEFAKALPNFQSVVDSNIESPLLNEARTKAIQVRLAQKDFAGAHDVAESAIASGGLDSGLRLQFVKLKFEANKGRGNFLGAIGNLVYLHLNENDPALKVRYREESMRLLETKLSAEDIHKIASGSEFEYLRSIAWMRLANSYLDKGQVSEAREALQNAIQFDTVGDIKTVAERTLSQLQARSMVNPKAIGVVLPLSGKFQKIGQKALHGLQLALGIFSKPRSSVELSVIDSEGNPDIARRAVDRLLIEDRVVAIVGGILSKEAEAIATKAQEYGVPSILLSQKSGLTNLGEFIFKNAVTSEIQVRQLVDTAMNQKGLKKFAVVYLNNPYGVEYANAFWDEVLAQGGEVVAAQSYDANETDFRHVIQRLIGTFYVDDRLSEYKLRLAEWHKKSDKKIRKNTPKDLLPPIVDFDGIFIPDRPEVVGQVAAMLVSNDVTKVTVLGPDTWNTNQIIDRVGRLPLHSLFVDLFGPEDTRLSNSKFGKDFKELFGANPSTFEMHAWESGVLLRQIIEAGESSRIGVRQKLAAIVNFGGAVGTSQMSATREVVHPLTPLTVEDQKIIPFGVETIP